LRLLSDPVARATLGASALRRAQTKYEIVRMLDETEQFYISLLHDYRQ